MRVWTAIIVVLVACGGGDSTAIDAAVDPDAGIDAFELDANQCTGWSAREVEPSMDAIDPVAHGGALCNPLAQAGQQGCATGQKCTWIRVADTPGPIGKLGCVADGSVPLGATCSQGPVGEATGFDDCAVGAICINRVCLDICGFDGSLGAACAPGTACTRYQGVFSNAGDDPTHGACQPQCDPLRQAECGPGRGCYLLTNRMATTAICAGAGTGTHGQTIPPERLAANACSPGFMPRRRAGTTSEWECAALCKPVDVVAGQCSAQEGGLAPDTCGARGAPLPDDPTAGETCQYFWSREHFDDPAQLSPYSNTVGLCFPRARTLYDATGDGIAETQFPSCRDVTTADVLPPVSNPPVSDATYFFCVGRQP